MPKKMAILVDEEVLKMSGKMEAPKPGDQLFENLFVNRDREQTLETISEGLIAFMDNARRLLEDAEILLKAERSASTQFLITTANEEMAKSYILLDACRLDLSRHKSELKRLCLAFYDHVTKYAYNRVIRWSPLHDMADVKEKWDIETKKWWPSGEESGEPDMPHATYFMREMPLYVDFIDYDQDWSKPEQIAAGYNALRISNHSQSLSEAQQALKRLERTHEAGLYSPQSLAIFNDNFRRSYITEKTPSESIDRLYEKAAQQIENDLGISREEFLDSALHEWPLYAFTKKRERRPKQNCGWADLS